MQCVFLPSAGERTLLRRAAPETTHRPRAESADCTEGKERDLANSPNSRVEVAEQFEVVRRSSKQSPGLAEPEQLEHSVAERLERSGAEQRPEEAEHGNEQEPEHSGAEQEEEEPDPVRQPRAFLRRVTSADSADI